MGFEPTLPVNAAPEAARPTVICINYMDLGSEPSIHDVLKTPFMI